jgi:hypothetical protein
MALKDFSKSISFAIENMDIYTLEPISFISFHPMFSKEWIDRIEKTISKLKNKKISDIVNTIKYSTHLRAQMYFLMLDMKSVRLNKNKRIEIAEFFDKILNEMSKADPYGFKSNIIQSKNDVKKILDKKFSNGNEKIAVELGKLMNVCYHLANALYTDFYTDYCFEHFGPFNIHKNKILVIQNFKDLNSQILWPKNKIPVKNIVIYKIYENVEFSCDALSCHSQYKGNPVKSLVDFRIEVDNNEINIEEMIILRKRLEVLTIEQWDKLSSMDKENLKKKVLFMRCYILKDFFELAGVEWKPSKNMLKVIKNKDLDKCPWNFPKEKRREYWEKLINPYIDFFG